MKYIVSIILLIIMLLLGILFTFIKPIDFIICLFFPLFIFLLSFYPFKPNVTLELIDFVFCFLFVLIYVLLMYQSGFQPFYRYSYLYLSSFIAMELCINDYRFFDICNKNN